MAIKRNELADNFAAFQDIEDRFLAKRCDAGNSYFSFFDNLYFVARSIRVKEHSTGSVVFFLKLTENVCYFI
jgi:hypothetical protein